MVRSGTKRSAAFATALCSAASEPDKFEAPRSPGTLCAESVISGFLPRYDFLSKTTPGLPQSLGMVARLRDIVATGGHPDRMNFSCHINIGGTSFSLADTPIRPGSMACRRFQRITAKKNQQVARRTFQPAMTM